MKRITLFFSAVFLATLSFGQFSQVDPQDEEKLLRDKERAQRSEQTFADPSQKMVSSSIQHAPAVRSVEGALQARNGKNISVLVASPNATDFNTHVLSLMQAFGGIDYTVTSQLGALTVEEMLTYDVVWTFNVTLWETETGTTPVEWSDKLGAFIDQGGFLLESQFVNGWDNWGLGSGLYITGNKSPFIKSTLDRPVALTNLGNVAQPAHPIMSGVTTLSTDYFIQNVTVRSDATLIASWGNSFADPLVAVYDNIVAVNADPIMSTGSLIFPGITGDGFLMFHNALVWLYNNQADPDAPAAPSALTATAGAEGALSATLNWTNPTTTFDGGTLDAITAVKIYRDGQLIHTIDDLGVGAAGTYTDNDITASGIVNYQVAAENSVGEGPAASASVFVGVDVPAAPANLELEAVGNDGLLTWDAPTAGLNGGYFVNTGITYTVTRYPGALQVATGITETTFSDTNIPQPGVYFYTVQAENATGLGGGAISNSVLLGAEGLVFMMNGEVTSCEGTFFDSGGPDGTYSASENFTLTFFPETEGAKMRFNFTSFAVESNTGCTWDALEVFDGPNTDATLVGRFCGSTVPAALAELTSTHPTGAITFRFTSDGSVQHAGWEADFYCYVAADNDLRATAISGNPTPSVGLESIYQVTVFNEGGLDQIGSAYTVELKDAAHNVLASVPGVDIASGETLQVPVAWTPQTAGPLNVYGYVNFAADDNPDNNSSPLLHLVIQEADVIAVTIGTAETFPPNRVPFDFFYKNNVSQTLYYPEEIGIGGGAITAIAYKNSFTTNLPDKPVRVWIGETELENLNAGWVDPATLTLVYDGTADFPSGINDIILTLDMPYIYTGGNLVVYTQRVWEDQYFASTDRFYGTEDPNSGRTRRASADATVYDPAEPPAGSVMHWLPNTTLFFSTAGLGALEGTVTDGTDPIEGVKVSVMGTMASAYTDEVGAYAFPYLLPGTYDIQFELFGYTTVVEEDVVIEEEENTTLDVTLNAIAQYTVEGVVKGNDDLFLEGAAIMLEGYDDYMVLTNADGEFTIDDVYDGTYVMTIHAAGYETLVNEALVVDADLDLGEIVVVEIIVAPFGLLVEEGPEAGEATFSWNNNFEVEFRYDDGTATGQLGSSGGSLNTVLGSVHRNDAVLNEMSWYLTSEGGPHATVKVWVFGLNASGQPDPANVLYSAENVPNVDAQWNTHVFPQPVEAPNGFLIGVSYNGFAALGTDNGTGDWPFQSNTHYFVGDVTTETFGAIETLGDFSVNFLIRAIGIDNGPLGTKVEMTAGNHTQSVELSGSLLEEPVVTGQPAYSTSRNPAASKAFVGYNVYLDDMTAPVATQVNTTEFVFAGLSNGDYVAGVQSVYTSGASEVITEPFTITNGVVEETHTVTFRVHMHAVEFDPDTDEIYISGEFPQWVEPGQDPDFLLQTTDDPMILTLTLELEAGDYAYKYFMGTGWNNGEWPGSPDRVITVDDDMTIDNVFGDINDPVSVPGISDASLSLFPNPASSMLSIVSGEMIREVRMIDMLGQVVYNSSVQGERHELNVAGFRNGIYFVQVLTGSELQTLKVQIQK